MTESEKQVSKPEGLPVPRDGQPFESPLVSGAGEAQEPMGSLNFRPLHIKGEPLSTTILRDRR